MATLNIFFAFNSSPSDCVLSASEAAKYEASAEWIRNSSSESIYREREGVSTSKNLDNLKCFKKIGNINGGPED